MSRATLDGFTVDLNTEDGIPQCWITREVRGVRYAGELRRVRIRAALAAADAADGAVYCPIAPETLARIETWAAERGYPN